MYASRKRVAAAAVLVLSVYQQCTLFVKGSLTVHCIHMHTRNIDVSCLFIMWVCIATWLGGRSCSRREKKTEEIILNFQTKYRKCHFPFTCRVSTQLRVQQVREKT